MSKKIVDRGLIIDIIFLMKIYFLFTGLMWMLRGKHLQYLARNLDHYQIQCCYCRIYNLWTAIKFGLFFIITVNKVIKVNSEIKYF